MDNFHRADSTAGKDGKEKDDSKLTIKELSGKMIIKGISYVIHIM